MILLEDIDKYLLYFNARIVYADRDTFTVISYDRIPIDLNQFCVSYKQSLSYSPVYILGDQTPFTQEGTFSYEYTFRVECLEDIKAVLLFASESIRFKLFEASFDKDLEDALDPQN